LNQYLPSQPSFYHANTAILNTCHNVEEYKFAWQAKGVAEAVVIRVEKY